MDNTQMKKKKRPTSLTFIATIVIFIAILGFISYQTILYTGLIGESKDLKLEPIEVILDTNQIKLDYKDSIINNRDSEILILRLKLEEKPDTIFVPKYIRKPDSIVPKTIVINTDSTLK